MKSFSFGSQNCLISQHLIMQEVIFNSRTLLSCQVSNMFLSKCPFGLIMPIPVFLKQPLMYVHFLLSLTPGRQIYTSSNPCYLGLEQQYRTQGQGARAWQMLPEST